MTGLQNILDDKFWFFEDIDTDSNGDLKMIKLLEEYGADWDHNIGVYEHWENQASDIPYKKYERKTEA